MISKVKRAIIFMLMLIVISFTGCSEADRVNQNLSKQADYFECERPHSPFIRFN